MNVTRTRTFQGTLTFKNLYTGAALQHRAIIIRVINCTLGGHRAEMFFRSGGTNYRFWASEQSTDGWRGNFEFTDKRYNEVKHVMTGHTEGCEVNDMTFSDEGGALKIACLWIEKGQVWPMTYDGTLASEMEEKDDPLDYPAGQ